jgi:hypothetical protein
MPNIVNMMRGMKYMVSAILDGLFQNVAGNERERNSCVSTQVLHHLIYNLRLEIHDLLHFKYFSIVTYQFHNICIIIVTGFHP